MKHRNKILALTILLSLFVGGSLPAEQAQIGETEFRSHCAGCHGLDGTGNGPFVEFLKVTPNSLTTLAQENEGVFPFRRVYDVIDGTNEIAAHGTKDMPVWGQRYAAEIIAQYGEFGSAHPGTVRCRILELVFFLSTLQEP